VPKGKLDGKKAAIEAFLKLIRSDDGYLCWEEPEAEFATTNLLPAYANTYDNPELKTKAPLLPLFRDSLSDNFVVNHSDIWNGMRAAGAMLEKDLNP
jgi:hypothetical protein